MSTTNLLMNLEISFTPQNWTQMVCILSVVQDTLYRQTFINFDNVIDSTRYVLVSGALKEVGTPIQAGAAFSMEDDIDLPSSLTLTLNDDSTGFVEEVFDDKYQPVYAGFCIQIQLSVGIIVIP